ncbi:MAG: FliM/FliN family flagellar motor switch protein [Sedimentisphaerales bacterium]|jgi:flagellar motor switch protein FliN/FliY|nr:FliM/FliN family flagellar motor switch protein [Sedimentisphaerales bacterium]
MAKADKAVAVKEKQEQQNNGSQAEPKKQVQSVEFAEAVENEQAGAGGSIDILLDMDIPVTVTIGQTEVPIRRLLQLGPGSVLKLGKPIDEPVELYLRDIKFAAGSVVVVDERFAIKIKEIFGLEDSGDKNANGNKKPQ